MTDITYIIMGVILIIFGIIMRFVIPFLRTKMNVNQIATLKQVVNIAVYAAEQILGPKMGKDKKAFALDYVKKLLAKFNLTFDETVIDAAIEAQVKELKIEVKE